MDSYGKDGHLWKRRALMEKTRDFLLAPDTTSITHIIRHTKHLQASLGRTEKRIIDLSNIPNARIKGPLMRFIIGLPRTYNNNFNYNVTGKSVFRTSAANNYDSVWEVSCMMDSLRDVFNRSSKAPSNEEIPRRMRLADLKRHLSPKRTIENRYRSRKQRRLFPMTSWV